MNQHLENVKKLLDGAIKGGLFPNAESVEICSRSVKEIAVMVGEYERMKKTQPPSMPKAEDNGHRIQDGYIVDKV